MSANQMRLDVRIDVFEKTNQWAKPLLTLKPAELVEGVLLEFQELEYLSKVPADYYLVQGEDGVPLEEGVPLSQQVVPEVRLRLVEAERPLPRGGRRPPGAAYLRDLETGRVYKLHWLPAIIGRPDKSQPHNELIAVNLESYKMGLRVSRRHVQITELNGRYFVESMSRNPTVLKREGEDGVAVTEQKRPLQHGDIIQLARSNIAFKFIVRS
ncbi:MAG: FHA domain-containing protein [Chloroflexota bacterium]